MISAIKLGHGLRDNIFPVFLSDCGITVKDEMVVPLPEALFNIHLKSRVDSETCRYDNEMTTFAILLDNWSI